VNNISFLLLHRSNAPKGHELLLIRIEAIDAIVDMDVGSMIYCSGSEDSFHAVESATRIRELLEGKE